MSDYESARLLLTRGEPWSVVKREIEAKLKLPTFDDDELLLAALTHPSWGLLEIGKEHKVLARHGDRFINYYLSRKLVELDIEDSSEAKQQIQLLAANAVLDACGRKMDLASVALHFRTNTLREGTKMEPIAKHLADVVEALTGAIELDRGPHEASRFLDEWLWSNKDDLLMAFRLERSLNDPRQKRWETLQRECSRAGLPEPVLTTELRPHVKRHAVTVRVGTAIETRFESPSIERARVRAVRAAIRAVLTTMNPPA